MHQIETWRYKRAQSGYGAFVIVRSHMIPVAYRYWGIKILEHQDIKMFITYQRANHQILHDGYGYSSI